MSSTCRFLNSAGVVGAGSLPNVCMRSTVVGSLRIRTVSALSKVSEAALGTRAAAETVLNASKSVDTSIGNLRGEIESFLNNVAV